ncbi:hypothetical protein HUN41_00154 [Streptomyces phage Coruscant]|uniref:Uncharacterized protein n=1 Tax=Streptomyces phage Coruscant TaxID=2739834 RepID=A0A7G4AW73_9CAUD|nr:hypothetical protein PP454_gp154 [Streptomyces phage Coruscant]QMP84263.1 hypothetical protein HUN41_00154 [Streptomyces phage Coruscant]
MQWNPQIEAFEDFEVFEIELTKDLTSDYMKNTPKVGERGLCGTSRLIGTEWFYWLLLDSQSDYWICLGSSFKRI